MAGVGYFKRVHVVAKLLLMKTLSATIPQPRYHWKAEIISFLHVLLVWGVKLTRSLAEVCQS